MRAGFARDKTAAMTLAINILLWLVVGALALLAAIARPRAAQ